MTFCAGYAGSEYSYASVCTTFSQVSSSCVPHQKIRKQAPLATNLAEQVHKTSLSKLQFCSEEVIHLGHVITAKHVLVIQAVPKPSTKKQMLSFLGMISYCRQWIADYCGWKATLSALVHGKQLAAHDKVAWTDAAENASTNLLCCLY